VIKYLLNRPTIVERSYVLPLCFSTVSDIRPPTSALASAQANVHQRMGGS